MRAKPVKLKSLITLLLTLSLAFGTPVSMSMDFCDGDSSSASMSHDDTEHNCCQDQERHADDCQSSDCQCHTVTGGALTGVTINADDLMVAVVPSLSSRALVSTIHDLPKRPPRRA